MESVAFSQADQLRSPQKANQLGRGPVVAQALRLDALAAQHGVKELPPIATALMALDHVEIQTAQRRDLHQTWEKMGTDWIL